ncbi:MAG: hypothetical protein FJ090_16420 [Deltaproteobacteria bacterium]|nr:hypothetical protein [Deltaproteobacteria bacterium]
MIGKRLMGKKRKISLVPGQLVAISLVDATFGAAHVVLAGLFPVFALYSRRADSPAALVGDGWVVSSETPLATASMPGWVGDGTWAVVGEQSRDDSAYTLPGVPPKISFTSHFASDFLNAFHGLTPWDAMHDPAYFEKQLLPDAHVPPTRRFKNDIPVG